MKYLYNDNFEEKFKIENKLIICFYHKILFICNKYLKYYEENYILALHFANGVDILF